MTNESYWPLARYEEMYRRSIEDPEGFWSEQAGRLDWFERWHTVLDSRRSRAGSSAVG